MPSHRGSTRWRRKQKVSSANDYVLQYQAHTPPYGHYTRVQIGRGIVGNKRKHLCEAEKLEAKGKMKDRVENVGPRELYAAHHELYNT